MYQAPEVTIIERDGKRYGVLRFGDDLSFEEPIDDQVFTLPPNKQRYWFQRTLTVLDRRARAHLRRVKSGLKARKKAVDAVTLEIALGALNRIEGNEVQNGSANADGV